LPLHLVIDVVAQEAQIEAPIATAKQLGSAGNFAAGGFGLNVAPFKSGDPNRIVDVATLMRLLCHGCYAS
jgi:hypothetical protein